jgi:hypothetical protein
VQPSRVRPDFGAAHGDGYVLVTGATGLLGADLVRRWTRSGTSRRIAVLVRDRARWDATARRLALPHDAVVVLEGDGQLLLWGPDGVTEQAVRAGSVVCRQPGTGIAHAFRGGDDGMTLLLYGTRDPNDMCFYPRSRKLYIRGLGLITRVGEQLDYLDGED